MIERFVNYRVRTLCAPFPLAEAVTGGASVLGSLVSGIFNSSAQRKANKLQIQLAKEQNAFNERMLDKQNAFNLDMWHKENEYNSPTAQVQRMLAAGLNPAALAGTSGQSGLSTNMPQSESFSPAALPNIVPESGFGDAIGNMSSQFLNMAAAFKSLTEIKGTEIDNANKDAMLKATIDKLRADGRLSDEQANNINWESTIKQTSFNDLIQITHQQALDAMYKAEVSKIESEVKQKYGDKIGEAELNKVLEEVNLLVEQGKTEQAQQLLFKATKDKALSDMYVNRSVGLSQIRANNAAANQSNSAARLNAAQAYGKELENDVYQLFGKSKAAADLIHIMQENDINSVGAAVERYIMEEFEGKHGKTAEFTSKMVEFMSRFLNKVVTGPVKGMFK